MFSVAVGQQQVYHRICSVAQFIRAEDGSPALRPLQRPGLGVLGYDVAVDGVVELVECPRVEPVGFDSGGPLTARELEMLRYLALGWDIANIVVEMGLSPHTVRNHSTNPRRKLDVRSSIEAVMAAVCLGVLTFDEGAQETDESGRMFPGAGGHEGLQPAGVKLGLGRIAHGKRNPKLREGSHDSAGGLCEQIRDG